MVIPPFPSRGEVGRMAERSKPEGFEPLPPAKVYVFSPPPGRQITQAAAHEFGERFREVVPDAKLVILPDGGSTLTPIDGTLDAAWAEAEAALPEGWRMVAIVAAYLGREWQASAHDGRSREHCDASGPTPIAALRALAAALRERAK